jgi:hypothetical protein
LIVVDKDLSSGEAADQSGFGWRLKKTANAACGFIEGMRRMRVLQ